LILLALFFFSAAACPFTEMLLTKIGNTIKFNLLLEEKGDRLRWMRCKIRIDFTTRLTRSAKLSTSSVGFAASFSSQEKLNHYFKFLRIIVFAAVIVMFPLC